MGRQGTFVKSGNRTRSTIRAAEKEDNKPPGVTFFRRFPRLGSSFQTKVPSTVLDSYQPSRESPLLLSSEYPDCTDHEVQNNEYYDYEAPDNNIPTPSTAENHLRFGEKEVVQLSQTIQGLGSRGGIRVSYGPGTATTDSIHCMRPFCLGPVDRDDEHYFQPNTLPQQELDEKWLNNLLEWHQFTLDCKQSTGGRRSRFKRPREAPSLPDFGQRLDPRPTKRAHSEGDELILFNPVTLDHYDAVQSIPNEQIKWSQNVTLSGGRAVRGLRKRRREGELDSWSKMPVSTIPMLGDFRSEPLEKPVALLSASSRSVASTWEAVLAAAEAYEKNISTIKLDLLLDFFDHIRRLPPPSQVLDETTRIAQTVNECLGRLWKACTEARKLRSKWLDLWYSDCVDLDAVRKALKVVTPLVPDEYEELQRQLAQVTTWQERLDVALAEASNNDADFSRNDLLILESLAIEAEATHGFRCKGLITLQSKLQKAYEMRDKLIRWREEEPCATVKTMAAMVKEIQRLKIRFPEANQLLQYSRDIDLWVERADIAIRSRISLNEVEDLIRRGNEYRLDLTEYLDKLNSRAQQAEMWLDRLKLVVDLDGDRLHWMYKIRAKLEEGLNSQLHDLACEGSRLPVDLDFVQMIQIELDARLWSAKARKWIPMGQQVLDSSKEGKIEEVRDHMEKAATLRARVPLSFRKEWKLDLEIELDELVKKADNWFERYNDFFEGGNRKTTTRRALSIHELRQIDGEATSLPINLGTAYAKVNRFLVQAETWYNAHRSLLVDAGLETTDVNMRSSTTQRITLDMLKSAKDVANSSISFDLEEVGKLSAVIDKVESWMEQVSLATGVSKRRARGKKTTYTVEELRRLIDDASDLPIDSTAAVDILEERILSVQEWRERVMVDLDAIATGLDKMRHEITSDFGSPDSFSRRISPTKPSLSKDSTAKRTVDLYSGNSATIPPCPIETQVDRVVKEVASFGITTPEMEIVTTLEHLGRWIPKSIKYLKFNDEIFDKRFFGAFDRFLTEGEDLVSRFSSHENTIDKSIVKLNEICALLVKDQLKRLRSLLSDRDEFSAWCTQAEKIISNEDKRCTFEKLKDMNAKATKFPAENELVKQIVDLTAQTNEWISSIRQFLHSEERWKMPELKTKIDEGEKFGIQSSELRELRNGLKAARAWSNRVKKCKPELCTAKMSDVQALVDDYESLMVEMPEEIARLNKAIKHYCICRGQYDGQMIVCDECKDSFHASCLGISKARVEKMEKFVCVRCSIKKVYKTCSETVASIVRKWTNEKELQKTRQAEAQKHHRKVRKETKEIEKHRKIVEEVAQDLAQVDNLKCRLVATETSESRAEGNNIENRSSGLQSQSHLVGAGTEQTSGPPEESDGIDIASLDTRRVELVSRMEKATKAIEQCQTRLKTLENAALEREDREQLEDAQSIQLRRWCLLVKSVLAPPTKEEADSSRPGKCGKMSPCMLSLVEEGKRLCVSSFRDVCSVENALKGMCWSAGALEVLRRQPSSSAVENLVALGKKCKLPEDKGLKMLRTMSQRADAWNLSFRRVLTPVPGQTAPFDMNELHELAKSADKIPLLLPYEHRLENVIEDEGVRYCLCGGPSDGRFMVGCDKCEKWFHGVCVGVRGNDGEEMEKWFCPECQGSPVDPRPLVETFHDTYGSVEEYEDDDVASKAPDPSSMWPPFGLWGSQTASEALGQEEIRGPWLLENKGRSSPQQYQNQPGTPACIPVPEAISMPSLLDQKVVSYSCGVMLSLPGAIDHEEAKHDAYNTNDSLTMHSITNHSSECNPVDSCESVAKRNHHSSDFSRVDHNVSSFVPASQGISTERETTRSTVRDSKGTNKYTQPDCNLSSETVRTIMVNGDDHLRVNDSQGEVAAVAS